MKYLKIAWCITLVVLVVMYFLGCVAIVITSLGVADFYWHKWWMCPIQIFGGLFLAGIGVYAVMSWAGDPPKGAK